MIIPKEVSSIHLQLKGSQWFKVTKLEEIFDIFDKIGDVPYRLVAGNTGQGKQQLLNMYMSLGLCNNDVSLTESIQKRISLAG